MNTSKTVLSTLAAVCLVFAVHAHAQPVFVIDSVSLAPDIKAVAQAPITGGGQPVGYAARFSMFNGGMPLYTLEADGGVTIHAPSAHLNLAGQVPANIPCAGKQVGFVIIEAGGQHVLIPAHAAPNYSDPSSLTCS